MQREKLLNGFSVRLKEVRKRKKKTQDQFAEALGVSKTTYVRYELGDMMPKLQILPILEEEYNVDLNWLITGKGEMDRGKGLDYIRGINPGIDDRRYIELLELCNVPEVEQVIMAKLVEMKCLMRSEIDEFLSGNKQSIRHTG